MLNFSLFLESFLFECNELPNNLSVENLIAWGWSTNQGAKIDAMTEGNIFDVDEKSILLFTGWIYLKLSKEKTNCFSFHEIQIATSWG